MRSGCYPDILYLKERSGKARINRAGFWYYCVDLALNEFFIAQVAR